MVRLGMAVRFGLAWLPAVCEKPNPCIIYSLKIQQEFEEYWGIFSLAGFVCDHILNTFCSWLL